MAKVTMFYTPFCPYCIQAGILLKSKGATVEKINVAESSELRSKMTELSGATSVPQIWIGQQHIGGCDELHALEDAGELDGLLQG